MAHFAPSLKRKDAFGSPEHTGAQVLVYNAIAAGHKLVGEIAQATGLELDTVGNAIRRLRDAGDIGRERVKGAQHTAYFVRGKRCLLAEVWK